MWTKIPVICFSTEFIEVVGPDRFKGLTELLGKPSVIPPAPENKSISVYLAEDWVSFPLERASYVR